jgi:hypothetical protein
MILLQLACIVWVLLESTASGWRRRDGHNRIATWSRYAPFRNKESNTSGLRVEYKDNPAWHTS